MSSTTAPFIVAPGVQPFFEAFGIGNVVRDYSRGETIFQQGDAGQHVWYVESGGVSLSVASATGATAVVGTLGPGDFFGEGGLASQPFRLSTATAITPSGIRSVNKRRMMQLLHSHPAMCDWFISNLLSRTMRVEEDLAKQFFQPNGTRGIV